MVLKLEHLCFQGECSVLFSNEFYYSELKLDKRNALLRKAIAEMQAGQ